MHRLSNIPLHIRFLLLNPLRGVYILAEDEPHGQTLLPLRARILQPARTLAQVHLRVLQRGRVRPAAQR